MQKDDCWLPGNQWTEGWNFQFHRFDFWGEDVEPIAYRQWFNQSCLSNGLPWWQQSIHLQCRRPGFDPCFRKIPLKKGIATHSSIVAWRIHGQWSLAGYNPWSCKMLDRTEQLSMHAHLCNEASIKTQKRLFWEILGWWTHGYLGRITYSKRTWNLGAVFQTPCPMHLFHLDVPELYLFIITQWYSK